MILGIEHLGIAVADGEASRRVFDRLLGKTSYKTENVTSEGVRTTFYEVGKSKLELLEDLAEDEKGIIWKYIERRGEGIHHIALAVDNIRQEIARLKEEGFAFVNEVPKPGADSKLICFLHPKSTNGVLVELCQDRIDK